MPNVRRSRCKRCGALDTMFMRSKKPPYLLICFHCYDEEKAIAEAASDV